MYRLAHMHKWIAIKITPEGVEPEPIDLLEDVENAYNFVLEGSPVLYAAHLEDAAYALGIDEDEIEVVERETADVEAALLERED